MNRTTEILARLRLDSRQFDTAVAQSDKQVQSLAKSVGAIPGGEGLAAAANRANVLGVAFRALPTAIAATAVAMGALAVKAETMGAAFEHSIGKLRTLGSEVEANLEALRAGVLQTFTELPITESLEDVTDSLYEILSSGVDASRGVETLRVAAEAAVGGFTTTRIAVDGLTTAMNAYRGMNLDARTASDEMTRAVQLGKIRYGELAQSMGTVLPIAAALGVPFRDIMAATAQLSLQGVQVSTAMSGLRQVLVNIQRPTQDFTKAFPELAKQFTASRLAGDGLIVFLRDLQRAAGGNREVFTKLFSDVDGLNAVMGLVGDGTAGAQRALEAIRGSAGATSEAMAKVAGSTVSTTQVLKNQFIGAVTDLGASLDAKVNPALLQFARLIARLRGDSSTAGQEIRRFNAQTIPALAGADRDAQAAITRTAQELFNQFDRDGAAMFARDDLDTATLRRFRGSLAARPAGFNGVTPAMIRNMLSAVDARIRELERLDTERATAQADAETKARADAAEAQRQQEAAARARERAEAAETARKEAERRREQRTRAESDLGREAARLTRGAAAELELVLREWLTEMRRLGVDPKVIAVGEALRTQAIVAQRAVEAAAPALRAAEAVLRVDGDGSADSALAAQGAAPGLDAAIAQLEARRDELQAVEETRRNLEAIAKVEGEIIALVKVRDRLSERIGESFKLPGKESREMRDTVLETATAITTAVDGAVALASAMGQVGDGAQRSLQAVSLLARGAVELARTLATADLGTIAGAASAAGAALGVAGSLAGIIAGFRAEDRARAEELRRNTAALEELGKNLGDFATRNITGDTGARLARGLERVLYDDMNFGTPRQGYPGRNLERQFGGLTGLIANRAGLTVAEVERAIAESGLTLRPSVGSVRQLLQFFQGDTAGYRSDFGGALQRLEDTLRADGITDAVEILRRRVALLSEPRTGFPALARALDGLDLTTAEGRATALDRARSLFDRLATGDLALGDFGGLTVGEGRQQLLDLITALRDTTQGGPAGTGGFNESRTITEVTGSRLAGLLGTANTYLADIERNTRGLRVPVLPTLAPPALPSPLGSLAGASVVVAPGAITLNITVPFTAAADPAAAMRAGEAFAGPILDNLARALAPRLNDALGQIVADKRLLTGDARLSPS